MAETPKHPSIDKTVTARGQPTPLVPGAAPAPKPQPQKNDHAASQRIGKYQLLKLLGKGGMGAVYEALDTVLQRRVALKTMPDEISASEDAIKRFVREARTAAQLNHPNAVAVYDVARKDTTTYIVMELVVGANAQELIDQRGGLPVKEATRIVADACRALAAAHKAGLIHRDIKPNNIFISRDGAVKLGDFGLAKLTTAANLNITQERSLLGTPPFMSPEQCQGKSVDSRTDLYSLGATYYNLLTGRVPYKRDSLVQILYAHCHDPIPDPRTLRPDVPEACHWIVQKAMAKEAKDRYASADAMLADLESVLGTGLNSLNMTPPASGVEALAETLKSLEASAVPSGASPSRGMTMMQEDEPTDSRAMVIAIAVTVGALVIAVSMIVAALLMRSGDREKIPTTEIATAAPPKPHPKSTQHTDHTSPTQHAADSTTGGVAPTEPPKTPEPAPLPPTGSTPPASVTTASNVPEVASAQPPESAPTFIADTPPPMPPAEDPATAAAVASDKEIQSKWNSLRQEAFSAREQGFEAVNAAFDRIAKFADAHRNSTRPAVVQCVNQADEMVKKHREHISQNPPRPGGPGSGSGQGPGQGPGPGGQRPPRPPQR